MNETANASGTDIWFSGVPRPVRLTRCAPLTAMTKDVFPTWPFRISDSAQEAEPVITVRRVKGGYKVDAPWLDGSIFADTPVCAFSSIVADVVYAWLEANPAALCLHCAAAEFGGRLVVFPNTNKAGKSLLAARLMAENHACYGDDLMALTPEGEGMCFGVPPRLRLPIPATEKTVADFAGAHGGKADSRSLYLAPNAPCLAPFGQARPIGAFVMLARKEEGPAELVPADASDSLQNIVYQNLMRRGGALEVLDRSERLTEEKPCWYLRYARLDDAVALLRGAFAETGEGFSRPEWKTETANQRSTELITPARGMPRTEKTRRASAKNFIRRPDALLRQGQGSFFLLHETGDEIFSLNDLGRAVWELLAEPLSETEAAALIASVFPEIPRARIERDVVNLFAAFRKMNLILEA